MISFSFIAFVVQLTAGTIPLNGGCSQYPIHLCKNKCDIYPIGRDTEINFRWQVKTERTLVAKVTVKKFMLHMGSE